MIGTSEETEISNSQINLHDQNTRDHFLLAPLTFVRRAYLIPICPSSGGVRQLYQIATSPTFLMDSFETRYTPNSWVSPQTLFFSEF